MSRGNKKHQPLSALPPRGFYRARTAPLLAHKPDGKPISDKAFRLWHLIAAYGWDGGGCDQTDNELATQLDTSPRWIIKLRQELASAGLLKESSAGGRRLLLPVCPDEELSNEAPEPESQPNPLQEVIMQALHQHGVFPGPAEGIASLMIAAGLDEHQAIETFLAHMQDTISDQYPSGNLALTVWRLKQGWLALPESFKHTPVTLPDDPELTRIVEILIHRCGSPPKQAREAVASMLSYDWEPLVMELETLRWLAYCQHPRYSKGLNGYGAFIAARLKAGIEAPVWFKDYSFGIGNEIRQLRAILHRADDGESNDSEREEYPSDFGEDGKPRTEPEINEATQQAQNQWCTALTMLQMQMPRATFDTWVRQTTLLLCDGNEYVIGVNNEYAKDWLEHRLHNLIKRTLADIIGHNDIQIRFVVQNKQ